MTKHKRITAREYEHFNANCRTMSDRERGTFLGRVARDQAVIAKCDPQIARDLIKWLSRQVRGERVPVANVTSDVAEIMMCGVRARRAVAYKRSPRRAFDAAEEILKRYRSEVVRHADPLGMAMGIRFTGSKFNEGPRNIFFVE